MPLVEHIQLPSFQRLRQQGQEVLTLEHALQQDIRELHVGLLNMMPDAALQVTEQQFMRMVGNSNRIAQFYVHPFTVPGLPRSPEKQAYIDEHYTSFEQLRTEGLDALIITGANVANPQLEQEPFWAMLTEVIGWATEHVTSVLCSCLSTHALMKHFYNVDRILMSEKVWGVYQHRTLDQYHPLLRDINTKFDVPHSRWNKITRDQFESADLTVLIESQVAGVHMAVSADQFRVVYLQGHPEYDINSLLKEYKRDVLLYLNDQGRRPPHPRNYFNDQVGAIADHYIYEALRAKGSGKTIPAFPEADILPYLDNTWRDTGKSIFNNWLGLVYQLTNVDRRLPFVDGIDPNDPLGLR